jgi:carboxyl-terminal processing protease
VLQCHFLKRDFPMKYSGFWRFLLFAIYSLALVAVALVAGYELRAIHPPSSESYSLLREADTLIQQHFIGEMPDDLSLQIGMIRGLVAALEDPYTIFVDAPAHELQSDNLSGEYGGIGAHVSLDAQGYPHLIPFPDSPAAAAGIRENDVLLKVDGDPLEPGIPIDAVIAILRGPVGTTVHLVVTSDPGTNASRQLEIERVSFPIPSVTEYRLPEDAEIGVIVLSHFSERTPQELAEAYETAIDHGARAIILDLRNNAGGLLDSAVDVAAFFLSEGVIMIEESKDHATRTYRAETNGEAAEIALAVLVNGGTASAAEVVAAALQADRAVIIGQRTFGKGSVQVVLELSDGSSLHVTSSRWQTPAGDRLDQVGLEPDIPVESSGEFGDAYLNAAMAWLQVRMK